MMPSLPEGFRKIVLDRMIERIFPDWKRVAAAERRRVEAAFKESFEPHRQDVMRWASAQHAEAVDAAAGGLATIPLDFSTIPRRYGHRGAGDLWTEEDLLASNANLAVLGDPGAGKTTTLRRLAQAVTEDVDDGRFVVLIVCREQQWTEQKTLHHHISSVFGLAGVAFDDDQRTRFNIELLDRNGVLIVDGLDEVPRSQRDWLERDLGQLARRLNKGQIVLSCRTADYPAVIEHIVRVEILPLDRRQIAHVMEDLLGETDGRELFRLLIADKHPVGELADRPLFLLRLIALYRRTGSIPDRAGDIYDRIVEMMIDTWDAVRRVKRHTLSEYGKLETDPKREFLGELALRLLQQNLYRFDDDELSDAYRRLATTFGLPIEQARLVAREIESHTGLVVDSGDGYEFSHLSLHEFLAGDTAYRHHFDPATWTRRNPAVAAVAISRSPNPERLLGAVTREPVGRPGIPRRVLESFLARLGLERPVFTSSSIELGRHVLLLAFRAKLTNPAAIVRLIAIEQIRCSVRDVIDSMYDIVERERLIAIRPKAVQQSGMGYVPPMWFTRAVFEVIHPT